MNDRSAPADQGAGAGPSIAACAKAGLILLTLALFASEHLVHYAMGALAIGGVVEVLRHPRACRTWAAASLAGLFLLIWLPMLVAYPGAVAPQHSANIILPYLHFLPAAYFVMRAAAESDVRRLVTTGAALLIGFAAFDAFVQLIWQVDLFGYPNQHGRLMGVFYPKQRLGLLLAVFAPLYVDVVLRWCRAYPQLWLCLIPFVIVVVMSLKRTAWLMLVLGLLVYFVLRLRHGGRARAWLGRFALITLLAGVTIAMNPTLQARLAATSGLFSPDAAAVDVATAYRVTLWRTGLTIFREHWLTGIGPRGFRHAYKQYAPAGDFWVARTGSGQTHPHLVLLEVAVETGVIGLVAFALFYAALLRLLLRPPCADDVPVWLLCATIAAFPLNAHMAFYGAYWSTLVWLLLGLGLAEVSAGAIPAPAAVRASTTV